MDPDCTIAGDLGPVTVSDPPDSLYSLLLLYCSLIVLTRVLLTGDPADVAAVGAAQPVGGDTVVKAQRVQSYLEGAHVQGPVWAAVGSRLRRLGGREESEGVQRDSTHKHRIMSQIVSGV